MYPVIPLPPDTLVPVPFPNPENVCPSCRVEFEPYEPGVITHRTQPGHQIHKSCYIGWIRQHNKDYPTTSSNRVFKCAICQDPLNIQPLRWEVIVKRAVLRVAIASALSGGSVCNSIVLCKALSSLIPQFPMSSRSVSCMTFIMAVLGTMMKHDEFAALTSIIIFAVPLSLATRTEDMGGNAFFNKRQPLLRWMALLSSLTAAGLAMLRELRR